jgi:hypothetical protein
MIVFCPGCGSRISVQPATPGGDVECPRCHSTFSTAGLKDAAGAPPPKRFRPKKAGRSKLATFGIAILVLLILAGGTAGVLYFTGVLGPKPGGGTGLSSATTPAQPTWSEYTNAEGRFSVLFPGTPTRDTIPPPSKLKAGAKAKVQSFTVDTPDASYAVAFEDTDAKTGSAEQLVEKHRSEAATGRAGKVISEKDVTVGPHKGKELTIELTAGGTAHIRYVAAGSRLYKLTVLGARKPPDPGEVAKFFDSFQVTG